ncbi:RNB-domain-containing protein [Microthyrium microscopicum]|uniref:RNB-domain-containing protein n=1 Tax=Microthyrium microscopicum TaxID=703497 RepID=A0A6A6UBX2_9PEZI|nr:RNB-domain-containing protein [Microthyrium microscopicum]
MSICWRCSEKLLSRSLLQLSGRSAVRRSRHQLQPLLPRRHAVTLADQINTAPLLPIDYGDIRERLTQWQQEHGSKIEDPTSAQHESRRLRAYAWSFEGGDEDVGNSVDVNEWEGKFGDVGIVTARQFIVPGSLVEITPKFSVQDPIFAVCLRSHKKVVDVLTVNGRLVSISSANLRWHLPQWMPAADLAPLDPFLPTRDHLDADTMAAGEIIVHNSAVPREFTAPILTALNAWRNKVNSIYREHAQVLDNAHDLLADSVELQFGSLERITQKLLGHTKDFATPETLYAVRKALHRQPIGFTSDKMSIRRSQFWQIKPKELVSSVNTARNWIRQYREAMTIDESIYPKEAAQLRSQDGYKKVRYFLEHIRELILESRKDRECTEDGLGPSKRKGPIQNIPRKNGKFTQDETTLVRFVEYWCIQEVFEQDMSLFSLAPYLVQTSKMYQDYSPSKKLGRVFLQELGCFPSYGQYDLYLPSLMLPGQGTSARLDKVWTTTHQAENKSPKFVDSYADIRHDWGDLLVLCIDPPDTKDVDDGISIEEVPGHPDQHWLRVHVANPTAFIPPESMMSSLARQLTSSLYALNKTWTLLPDSYTRKCSLEAGAPTLTFSLKIDDTGKFLDYDIRHGTINNVKKISYGEVNEVLGLSSPNMDYSSVLSVGYIPKDQTPTPTPASSKHVQPATVKVLKKLKALMQVSSAKRFSGISVQYANKEHNVQTFSADPKTQKTESFESPFSRTSSMNFFGDPSIRLQCLKFSPQTQIGAPDILATSLVQESMLLACEVAGRWSWDRKIPSLYRGQMLAFDREDIMKRKKSIILPILEKTPDQYTWGDFLKFRNYQTNFLPGIVASRAIFHAGTNTEHYIKATSPLRRYSDMIAHWQIGAALRHEHHTGKSLATNNEDGPATGILPFTRTALESIMVRLSDREDALNAAMNQAEMHWIRQFYHRAHYGGEAVLPETFKICVVSDHNSLELVSKHLMARSLEHGVVMHMDLRDEAFVAEGGSRIFDIWEAKIEEVSQQGGKIIAKPLRLVERLSEADFESHWQNWLRVRDSVGKMPELTT